MTQTAGLVVKIPLEFYDTNRRFGRKNWRFLRQENMVDGFFQTHNISYFLNINFHNATEKKRENVVFSPPALDKKAYRK